MSVCVPVCLSGVITTFRNSFDVIYGCNYRLVFLPRHALSCELHFLIIHNVTEPKFAGKSKAGQTDQTFADWPSLLQSKPIERSYVAEWVGSSLATPAVRVQFPVGRFIRD